MGLGQSIEKSRGWKSQYDNMTRWYQRCEKVHIADCYTDFWDAVDFGLSFFIACHSLKDWLKKSCPNYAPPTSYPECMKICRDIANRVKHHTIGENQFSLEPDWTLTREYLYWQKNEGVRLLLYFQDLKNQPKDAPDTRYVFISVIRECKAFWDQTLKYQGIL